LISNTRVRAIKDNIDFAADVTIKTKDGQIYMTEVDVMAEFPELSEKTLKVKNKFDDIVIPILGEEKAVEFANAILSIEEMDNINELLQIARK